MTITYFDTETTGLTAPEVIQAAYISVDEYNILEAKEELFGCTKSIEWDAQGIHGITNEMVQGKALWTGEFLPYTEYLVIHNASYDTKFLSSSQLEGVKVLCTLKLARKLIDKNLSGSHKNSTLYYYLGCYKQPIYGQYLGKTHTALSDCAMTANILYAMLKQFNLTIEQAYQLTIGDDTSEPNNIDIGICPFKKWAGVPWTEVIQKDRDYVMWLLSGGKIQDGNVVSLVRGLL